MAGVLCNDCIFFSKSHFMWDLFPILLWAKEKLFSRTSVNEHMQKRRDCKLQERTRISLEAFDKEIIHLAPKFLYIIQELSMHLKKFPCFALAVIMAALSKMKGQSLRIIIQEHSLLNSWCAFSQNRLSWSYKQF